MLIHNEPCRYPELMLRLGTMAVRSVTRRTPATSSWSPEMNDTAAGTSCRDSSRRRAVTTTSLTSGVAASASGASADAGATFERKQHRVAAIVLATVSAGLF